MKTGTLVYTHIKENLFQECIVEKEFEDRDNDGKMYLELLRKEKLIDGNDVVDNFVVKKFFVSRDGVDRRVI